MMSNDDQPAVVTTTVGRVTVLTLNRPHRLNALNERMIDELAQSLLALGGDRDCRAIVITGAGRSFCAGMDLLAAKELGQRENAVAATYSVLRNATDLIVRMREIPQPIIAAVNGHAVGAGFALAAACDIRMCSSVAQFNAVFAKIGMSAGDLGLSWMLPRLIGHARAAEVFYTGGVIDAKTAVQHGLANRMIDAPLEEALTIGEQIASMPPLAIQMSKELLNASIGSSGLREHLELEMRSQVIGLMSLNAANTKSAAIAAG
jgi:enoyl-CoA hydratase